MVADPTLDSPGLCLKNSFYPLSLRIRTVKAILGQDHKIEPLPPPKHYAPRPATAAQRRR
jgi:hypothetical protein